MLNAVKNSEQEGVLDYVADSAIKVEHHQPTRTSRKLSLEHELVRRVGESPLARLLREVGIKEQHT